MITNSNLKAFYFSATGTTRKIVTGLAEGLAGNPGNPGNQPVMHIDFTLPEARKSPLSFAQEDLVVIGVPVYAGRVPNVLLKYLNAVQGNGASAIAVVVYGNRHFNDALIELKDILGSTGFKVVAGGAFIGEHSFSRVLGANRPDESDMAAVSDFAGRIAGKLAASGQHEPLSVPGDRPYRAYSRPKANDGRQMVLHKVTPKTGEDCIDCKLCVSLCPMGSIDMDDVSQIKGICLRCCACVKACPTEAKHFDDADFLFHKNDLETLYTSPRREPETFL